MKKAHPFKRLWLDNKKYWPKLALIILLALLAGVFKSRSATYWGEAVDFGVGGFTQGMINSVIFMLIFIALDGIRTIILYFFVGKTAEGMFWEIRMRLFNALSFSDMASLAERMRSGDAALRACEDTEQLCDIISNNFSNFLRVIFQALFAIVVCAILSWRLALAYFIFLPVSLWLLSVVSKAIERLQKKTRTEAGRSVDIALNAISGINAVKVFSMEKEMDSRFAEVIDEAFEARKKIAHIGMKMTIIKYTVNVMQVLALFIMGAWLVSQDLITIGAVMSFVILSVYVTEAMRMIDRMISLVKSAFALSGRIYETLDFPQEATGSTPPMSDIEEFVHFEGVSFSYDQEQKILSNLSLNVNKDQKIAIVGQSGSGKSTVIRLICRFYSHNSGKLKLFGVDGEKICMESLRKNLALVTQEPFLFEASILENVRFGREDATEDDVIEALKSANLWDFISSLPDGINTCLGEFGSRLSGGQRQRLSIARALIKDAKLVLLDEPTSALDTQTEQEIQHALENLLRGRAAVIVAHRLSTVQNADYMYCLENGAVIEEGTPAELYTKQGYYYEMCQMQGVSHA
ncbi:MAG: ABC transporter ATP-binding protein/permease [Defluviitaleaceae bacterium]|nr:ABC transporter ATP-binding protein/permease [Defluviitaleaceae bacterium]